MIGLPKIPLFIVSIIQLVKYLEISVEMRVWNVIMLFNFFKRDEIIVLIPYTS